MWCQPKNPSHRLLYYLQGRLLDKPHRINTYYRDQRWQHLAGTAIIICQLCSWLTVRNSLASHSGSHWWWILHVERSLALNKAWTVCSVFKTTWIRDWCWHCFPSCIPMFPLKFSVLLWKMGLICLPLQGIKAPFVCFIVLGVFLVCLPLLFDLSF